MYHVLVLFLIVMAVCIVLGYSAGYSSGKSKTLERLSKPKAATSKNFWKRGDS